MRPVTPSRRNEKKRERVLHRAPGAAADALHAQRCQPVARQARQVGPPARVAVGARLIPEARAARGGRARRRKPGARRRRPRRHRGPMQGPSQATSSCGSHDAPPHTACAQRSSTPALRPRQPACAAPTARACGAANSTGRQSATSTVQATPGSLVHDASAASTGARALSASRRTTRSPCTCRKNTGVAPMASAKRSRLACTASGVVAAEQAQIHAVPRRRADATGARGHAGADARIGIPLGGQPFRHCRQCRAARLTQHPGIRTAASWRTPAAPCRPRTRASCAARDRCGT